MKKVLCFCIALIMCVGLVGCGKEKTTLDKLENFTEQQDKNMFKYEDEDMLISFMYKKSTNGDLQIAFVDYDINASYIYTPNKDEFSIISGYDTDNIILYYDVKNQTATLDYDEYEMYDLSSCYSFKNCVDEITEDFSKKGHFKKANEFLSKLNKLLKENDLTLEDIDVPYDELDK